MIHVVLLILLPLFLAAIYMAPIATIGTTSLVSIITLILRKSWADNRAIFSVMTRESLWKSLKKTFLVWMPYVVVLAPGLYIADVVDRVLEYGIDVTREWSRGQTPIDVSTQPINDRAVSGVKAIRERSVQRYPWYHPLGWIINRLGKRVEDTISGLPTVQFRLDVSVYVLLVCSAAEAFLAITRWTLLGYVLYIILRSFGYVYARVYATLYDKLIVQI